MRSIRADLLARLNATVAQRVEVAKRLRALEARERCLKALLSDEEHRPMQVEQLSPLWLPSSEVSNGVQLGEFVLGSLADRHDSRQPNAPAISITATTGLSKVKMLLVAVAVDPARQLDCADGYPRPKRMTLAEFLKWDDGTDTLYELIDGRVGAMAPARDAHGTVVMNLAMVIGPQLTPPCRIVGNAGITRPERADSYYIADLAVTCDQPADQRVFLPAPRLIVEVLSRSTAAHDRGRKGEESRHIARVEAILFVFSDERRVEPWRRESERWVIEDCIGEAAVHLDGLGVNLPLPEIYTGTALD